MLHCSAQLGSLPFILLLYDGVILLLACFFPKVKWSQQWQLQRVSVKIIPYMMCEWWELNIIIESKYLHPYFHFGLHNIKCFELILYLCSLNNYIVENEVGRWIEYNKYSKWVIYENHKAWDFNHMEIWIANWCGMKKTKIWEINWTTNYQVH